MHVTLFGNSLFAGESSQDETSRKVLNHVICICREGLVGQRETEAGGAEGCRLHSLDTSQCRQGTSLLSFQTSVAAARLGWKR